MVHDYGASEVPADPSACRPVLQSTGPQRRLPIARGAKPLIPKLRLRVVRKLLAQLNIGALITPPVGSRWKRARRDPWRRTLEDQAMRSHKIGIRVVSILIAILLSPVGYAIPISDIDHLVLTLYQLRRRESRYERSGA